MTATAAGVPLTALTVTPVGGADARADDRYSAGDRDAGRSGAVASTTVRDAPAARRRCAYRALPGVAEAVERARAAVDGLRGAPGPAPERRAGVRRSRRCAAPARRRRSTAPTCRWTCCAAPGRARAAGCPRTAEAGGAGGPAGRRRGRARCRRTWSPRAAAGRGPAAHARGRRPGRRRRRARPARPAEASPGWTSLGRAAHVTDRRAGARRRRGRARRGPATMGAFPIGGRRRRAGRPARLTSVEPWPRPGGGVGAGGRPRRAGPRRRTSTRCAATRPAAPAAWPAGWCTAPRLSCSAPARVSRSCEAIQRGVLTSYARGRPLLAGNTLMWRLCQAQRAASNVNDRGQRGGQGERRPAPRGTPLRHVRSGLPSVHHSSGDQDKPGSPARTWAGRRVGAQLPCFGPCVLLSEPDGVPGGRAGLR